MEARRGAQRLIDRLLWRRWWRGTLLTLIALPLLLVVGQLAQLRWLWPLPPAAQALLPELIARAALPLLAAALPLTALIASGLLGASLRSGDERVALGALAYSPLRIMLPPLLGGICLGSIAIILERGPIPSQLPALRSLLEEITLDRLQRGGVPVSFKDGGAWLETVSSEEPAPHRGEHSTTSHSATKLWLTLPGRETRDGAVLQLQEPKLERVQALDGSSKLNLQGQSLALWAPPLRLKLDEVQLILPLQRLLDHRLRSLGPPNALPSEALDPLDPHHQYTSARRIAAPAMGPLWGLFGFTIGLQVPAVAALVIGAGTVAIAYAILRAGELRARQGMLNPYWAAWRPFTVLSILLLLLGLSALLFPMLPEKA